MYKIISTIACDRLIVDARTQSMSFIDILDTERAYKYPVNIGPINVCLLLERELSDAPVVEGKCSVVHNGVTTELNMKADFKDRNYTRCFFLVPPAHLTKPETVKVIFEVPSARAELSLRFIEYQPGMQPFIPPPKKD